ncbi:MAG: sigma-70 family RNA polymerase sigma factor [Microthrixaceae bacterium]|nr:sigma-70 family RNA polymerase sigma factor [Acidimicrobiales bacterium]MCB9404498.1 sigma-70 family RNA polymerase sigma factor [Microthrixaceae bacterium]
MDDFAQLVRGESRGLIAAVQAIVGDRSRAEEIVQDAFEKGYRSWWRVSRLDRPGAWVRRVAINEAISVGRRRASEDRAVARLTAMVATEAGGDPLAALGDDDVWAAVRALPSEQASAVALRYGADLSLDEIAQTMNISVSAVKSLLHRGRASLRGSEQLQSHVS